MAETGTRREQMRIAALNRLDVLDTPPEAPFENIVSIIRTVLGVPMAAVTLVDTERQWFKAQIGLPCQQTPRDISFCTHAVEQDTPFVIPDARADARFQSNALVLSEPHIRSYAGAQLTTSDGFNVGTLCAIDVKPRDYSAAEIALLSEFAKLVVNELELHRRADRDHLTGALTRAAFTRLAAQEMKRHRRYGHPACLILFDIDHFKRVNDSFGHPGGDAVLRSLAHVVQREIRPTDYFGRLGGEEFGLLLPEVTLVEAAAAAERLRLHVAENEVALGDVKHRVTASFGIAAIGGAFSSVDAWVAAADEALYRAKSNGRNRCETATTAGEAARLAG